MLTDARLVAGFALATAGSLLLLKHFRRGTPDSIGLQFGRRRVIFLNTQRRPIDPDDVVDIERRLDYWTTRSPGQPVVLMLHTGGGFFGPSVQITRAVQRHGNVWAFVPYYAMSGGTLIALGCRQIVMCPSASLGAVDPQIMGFSVSSILRIQEAKSPDAIDDTTHALIGDARKALDATTMLVNELAPAQARELLVAGVLPHSFPISREMAIQAGLHVKPVASVHEMNRVVEQLALSTGVASIRG